MARPTKRGPKGEFWSHASQFQRSERFLDVRCDALEVDPDEVIAPIPEDGLSTTQQAREKEIQKLARNFIQGRPLRVPCARPPPAALRHIIENHIRNTSRKPFTLPLIPSNTPDKADGADNESCISVPENKWIEDDIDVGPSLPLPVSHTLPDEVRPPVVVPDELASAAGIPSIAIFGKRSSVYSVEAPKSCKALLDARRKQRLLSTGTSENRATEETVAQHFSKSQTKRKKDSSQLRLATDGVGSTVKRQKIGMENKTTTSSPHEDDTSSRRRSVPSKPSFSNKSSPSRSNQLEFVVSKARPSNDSAQLK